MYDISPNEPFLIEIMESCRRRMDAVTGRSPIERWRRHALKSTAQCALQLSRGCAWDDATAAMNRRIAHAALYLGVERHIDLHILSGRVSSLAASSTLPAVSFAPLRPFG